MFHPLQQWQQTVGHFSATAVVYAFLVSSPETTLSIYTLRVCLLATIPLPSLSLPSFSVCHPIRPSDIHRAKKGISVGQGFIETDAGLKRLFVPAHFVP